MRRKRVVLALISGLCLSLLALGLVIAAQGDTERVSVYGDGQQAATDSYAAGLSADGRYVLVNTDEPFDAAHDSGLGIDAYVHDRTTGQNTLATWVADGSAAGGYLPDRDQAVISDDGNWIAFTSMQDTVMPTPVGYGYCVYLIGRGADPSTARLVSKTIGGAPNGFSEDPAISADGRYVAFESAASNLVADDTGNCDIFLYDNNDQSVTRISRTLGGANPHNGGLLAQSYSPDISADGRYVVYASDATDIDAACTDGQYDIFLYDRQDNATTWISKNKDGGDSTAYCARPRISPDGLWVTFAYTGTDLVDIPDTNNNYDIFLYSVADGTIQLVSLNATGDAAATTGLNPSTYISDVSNGGRYVAYISTATDALPVTDRLLRGVGPTYQVYVRDMQAGVNHLASKNSGGDPVISENGSFYCFITPDGRFVAFDAVASNLVADDTNDRFDAFVHDFLGPAPAVTSLSPNTGTTAGGTAVTITGTGFQAGAEATFGGTAATGVTVVSDTSITCVTPAHAAGAVDVVVTIPEGRSGTLAGGFTYADPVEEPQKPALVSPADGATDVSLTPTLQTEAALSDRAFGTHAQTQWQISTNAGFTNVIFDKTSTRALTSIIVPPYVLTNNTTYYWRARFIDQAEEASAWADAFSFTTIAAAVPAVPPEQSVGDGVDLDGDGTPDNQQAGMLSANSVVDGQPVSVLIDNATVASIDNLQTIDPADIADQTGAPDNLPYGLVSFKLTLQAGATTASVTIYLSEAAGDNAAWYKYDPANGWYDYSAHATFAADGLSVTLELEDGGFGDADGVVNGIIVDPSGLVQADEEPTTPNIGGGGFGSCFIDSLFD